MSRAKELLRAGLDNKGAKPETALFEDGDVSLEKSDSLPLERADDLEAVLRDKQPRIDRAVKRTFEMRERHVDILDKVVKKAKNNGKRITQSDALQFIVSNWNDKFGAGYLD